MGSSDCAVLDVNKPVVFSDSDEQYSIKSLTGAIKERLFSQHDVLNVSHGNED